MGCNGQSETHQTVATIGRGKYIKNVKHLGTHG